MCCRYTLRDPFIVAEHIRTLGVNVDPAAIAPRFNAAPTQDLPAVILTIDGLLCLPMRWGMVPFYARKDPKRLQLINARSEIATEKPTLKHSVQNRRCVLPSDGFFEWQRHPDGKTKTPFYIRRADEKPFLFAGIYEEACEPFVAGFVLLTTGANEIIKPIHDRMPVILELDEARAWLTPGPLSSDQVRAFCDSYPATQMRIDPVGTIVDNTRNDLPECVRPLSNLGSGR